MKNFRMIPHTYLRAVILINLFCLVIALPVAAQYEVIGVDAKLLSAETSNSDIVVGERAFYNVTLYNTDDETFYINFTVEVVSPSNQSLILREHEVEIPAANSVSIIPIPSLPGGKFQPFIIKENGMYTITIDTKDLAKVLVICNPFLEINITGNYTTFCGNSALTYQTGKIEAISYIPTPQEKRVAESSEAIANSIKNVATTLQEQTTVLEKLESKGTKLQQGTLLAALLAVFVAIASQWPKVRGYIFKATLEGTQHSEFWKIRERAKRVLFPFAIILTVAFILHLGGWSIAFDLVLAAGLGTYVVLLFFLGANLTLLNDSPSNIVFGLLTAALIWILIPSLFYFIQKFVNWPIRSFLGVKHKTSHDIVLYGLWALLAIVLYVFGVETESDFFMRLMILPFLFAFEILLMPQKENKEKQTNSSSV